MADVARSSEHSASHSLPFAPSTNPVPEWDHPRTAPSSNGPSERDASPGRSRAGDTQPSSADEAHRNGTAERPSEPASTNNSGSSSVSGATGAGAGASGSAAKDVAHTIAPRKGPQSFFSGSKIKHLKKPDGIPLWRRDIQYEFLKAVFEDTKPVFTNSYTGQAGQTFSDVYVDAMARSSKTSKILRDKLTSDKPNALNMAMVCLLVNVGRMNTTLNFFPEMKAQLRTYHSIPSLQAYADTNAYKQLQDAPRLKSILKGACEDRKEPQTLEQIMTQAVPRTNPINLIFIMSTYAPKVTEQHFSDNMEFYDLIMRTSLSSKSRANNFLWLMWLYLESDFSSKACSENPFGKGKAESGKLMIPEFEYLTEEQSFEENTDPEIEKEYGKRMQEERRRVLGDPAPPTAGRGRAKKDAGSPSIFSGDGTPPEGSIRAVGGMEHYGYDSDTRTRSASSPEGTFQTPANGSKAKSRTSTSAKITSILNLEGISSPLDPLAMTKGGGPRSSSKRTADGEVKTTPRIKLNVTSHASGHMATAGRSITAPGGDRPFHIVERGTRPPRVTSHQMAVHKNRQDRITHEIEKKLRQLDKVHRRARLKKGAFALAWGRIKDMEDPFAISDDESSRSYGHPSEMHDEMMRKEYDHGELTHQHPAKRSKADKHAAGKHSNIPRTRGPAGLIPRVQREEEETDDYGEEALALSAVLRRTRRRMDRWESEDRQRSEARLALEDESSEGLSSGGNVASGEQTVIKAEGQSAVYGADDTDDDVDMGVADQLEAAAEDDGDDSAAVLD